MIFKKWQNITAAVLVDVLQCTTNQVILVLLLPSGPGYREQRPTWGPSTIKTHAPLRRPLLVASSAWPPAASRPSARLSFIRLASCSSGTAGGSGRRRRLEVPHAELLISGRRNSSSENYKIFFWLVLIMTFSLIFTRVTRCHSFFFSKRIILHVNLTGILNQKEILIYFVLSL